MNGDVSQDDVRREALWALQSLAHSPSEQIRVTAPGCVTCELYADYQHWHEVLISRNADGLTEQQIALLREVAQTLESIPNQAYDCRDPDAIRHHGWESVRVCARKVLAELGWPLAPPPNFEELRPGIWSRPGSGSSIVQ